MSQREDFSSRTFVSGREYNKAFPEPPTPENELIPTADPFAKEIDEFEQDERDDFAHSEDFSDEEVEVCHNLCAHDLILTTFLLHRVLSPIQ